MSEQWRRRGEAKCLARQGSTIVQTRVPRAPMPRTAARCLPKRQSPILHIYPFCDFMKTLEYTFPTIFLAKIVKKSRFWRLTGAVVLSLLSEVYAEFVCLGSRGKEVIISLESSANMTKSASSCKHGTHNSTLSCCSEQRRILGACSQRAAECYLKLHCLVTIKMLQDCVKGV